MIAFVAPGCEPTTPRTEPGASLDVVVDEGGVTVFVNPLERDCTCNSRFIADGTCGITFSDVQGCTCDGERVDPPWAELLACIREVRGTSPDGVELPANQDMPGAYSFGPETRELVIDGCGAVTRIPLEGLPVPEAISAGDVRRTGPGAADALVSVANATHAQLCLNTGFVVTCCDGESDRIAMPTGRQLWSSDTTLAAISGPVEHTAPSGRVRVWRRAQVLVGPGVAVPEPEGERWFVEVAREPIEIEAVYPIQAERMLFDLAAAGAITFVDANTFIELGATEDNIDLDVGEGVHYSAALPHAAIDRTLPLGELVRFDLVVDETLVTLTRTDDPSLTLEGTFRVLARLPAIARP